MEIPEQFYFKVSAAARHLGPSANTLRKYTDLGYIQALPRLPDCPYVFYNVKTRDRWHRMQTPWYRAREKAGVPGIRLQDLRAHYAIRLAESGVDMHDIKQMLGHSSVMTTERHYARFSPKRSASRVLKVLQGGKAVELKRNLKGDH